MRDQNRLTCAPPTLALPKLRVINGNGAREPGTEPAAPTLTVFDGGTREERSRALLDRIMGSIDELIAFQRAVKGE